MILKYQKQTLTPWAVLTLWWMLTTAGCDTQNNPEPSQDSDTITWTSGVQSIVARRCGGCHVAGGVAPFALDTYDDVASLAPAIRFSVSFGSMPPVQADPDCQSYSNDYWMPEEERSVLLAWLDEGAPAGDMVAFEPVAPSIDTLTEVDLVIRPAEPYEPPADELDHYHCLPFDAAFEEPVWVTAHELVPDAKELVHHVILYLVPPSGAASMEAEDEAHPGPGYPCYGTSGHGGQPMGVWAPGGGPQRFPDNAAFEIPAGARIVAQMHYNTSLGQLRPDQSSLKLKTTATAPEQRVVMPILNGFFEIPARTAQSFEFSYTFEQDMAEHRIFAIMPHMHKIGRQLHVEVERADGAQACLTEVTDWDFEWQQFYALEETDLVVRGGDKIHYRCTFDNSQGAQPVAFGEGTEDEMCLVVMAMVGPPAPQNPQESLCPDYADCRQMCAEPGSTDCYIDCIRPQPEACKGCMMQGIGECGQAHCAQDGAAFFQCLSTQCQVDIMDTEGILNCMQTTCREPFEAQWTCLTQQFEDGTCNANFDTCGSVP